MWSKNTCQWVLFSYSISVKFIALSCAWHGLFACTWLSTWCSGHLEMSARWAMWIFPRRTHFQQGERPVTYQHRHDNSFDLMEPRKGHRLHKGPQTTPRQALFQNHWGCGDQVTRHGVGSHTHTWTCFSRPFWCALWRGAHCLKELYAKRSCMKQLFHTYWTWHIEVLYKCLPLHRLPRSEEVTCYTPPACGLGIMYLSIDIGL